MDRVIKFPETLTQLRSEVESFKGNLKKLDKRRQAELKELLNVQILNPNRDVVEYFERSDSSDSENISSILEENIASLGKHDKKMKDSMGENAASYLRLVNGKNNGRVAEIRRIVNYYHPIISKEKTVIFLSYSASDVTLAFYLYVWFLAHGAFLYVDYFQSTKLEGNQLKISLGLNIQKSQQILFAATLASQIKLDGTYYIRPWCSWENGSFFISHDNPEDKQFFVNLFGTDENGMVLSMKNAMTKDMKPLNEFDEVGHVMRD